MMLLPIVILAVFSHRLILVSSFDLSISTREFTAGYSHSSRSRRDCLSLSCSSIFNNDMLHQRKKSFNPLRLALSDWEDDNANYSRHVSKRTKIVSDREEAYSRRQVSKIFGRKMSGEDEFVPLTLAGRFCQPKNNSIDIDFIFLSSTRQSQMVAEAHKQLMLSNKKPQVDGSISAIPLPLAPSISTTALRLISATISSVPISKVALLSLNSLFVNRDRGLFDNLPWSTWSIDPDGKERDAANNVVNEKYTYGKRVAYQRLMGKDWQGKSLSLGSLTNQIRALLEKDKITQENTITTDDISELRDKDEAMMLSLSKRLLELNIKEARMEIAECEQSLAVLRTRLSNEHHDDLDSIDDVTRNEEVERLKMAHSRIETAEESLQQLLTTEYIKVDQRSQTPLLPFSFPWENNHKKRSRHEQIRSTIAIILDKLDAQIVSPPYQGAIGYPTSSQNFNMQYQSPYYLLLDIINEQLNCDIIGCILEQTSLLEGNLVIGGALLLQRRGKKKSVILAGEKVQFSDEDDDFGNDGVTPKSLYVVECFTDEAICMALASGLPIYLERDIWECAGNILVRIDSAEILNVKTEGDEKHRHNLSLKNMIPMLQPLDGYSILNQVEGDKVSSKKDSDSIRLPLTNNPSIFDQVNQMSSSSFSHGNQTVFSTFSPVSSLDEYDNLTNDDKARILLKLESFQLDLPRLRVVRASANSSKLQPSALDNLLLPLIDETIRRQYLIRDAVLRNDFETADKLRGGMSQRQVALEEAQLAREKGLEAEATKLEGDAELYKQLRADVTQDEGAYSRFLDRDEWYERETQARLKRIMKSK